MVPRHFCPPPSKSYRPPPTHKISVCANKPASNTRLIFLPSRALRITRSNTDVPSSTSPSTSSSTSSIAAVCDTNEETQPTASTSTEKATMSPAAMKRIRLETKFDADDTCSNDSFAFRQQQQRHSRISQQAKAGTSATVTQNSLLK